MGIQWTFHDQGAVALDDVTRIATLYDAQRVQTGTRPATAEENSRLDAQAAQAAAKTAAAATRAAVKASITDLQAEKARMDGVLAKTPAQITGGDTKNVAQSAKRIADAAIEIARLLTP
jgi:hypothetical protein